MSEENFGLTATGLRLPRAADWLQILRDDFETRVEVAPIDWSRQTVLGPLSIMMSERLGKCSEILQAVYDSRSRNNANGVQLDDLAQLNLTERDDATFSTATVTLTSTADSTTAVFVDIGTLVSGGGLDGRARWETIEEVTIPIAGGTVDVVVRAIDEGPIAAGAGVITKILTPIEDWASVTNAAAATLGRAEESDPSIKRRMAEAPFRAGRGTPKSLHERVRALEFVTSAEVIVNDTADTIVEAGLTLTQHSQALIVFPATLTAAQQTELAQTIFEAWGGLLLVGTEEAVVTYGASEFDIRWNYATADPITVAIALTLYPGFEDDDVLEPVEDIAVTYFSELLPGDDVERDELICRIRDNVPGVKASAITLDGSPADYVVAANNIATIDGDPAVTVP